MEVWALFKDCKGRKELIARAKELAKQPGGKLTDEELNSLTRFTQSSWVADIVMSQLTPEELAQKRKKGREKLDADLAAWDAREKSKT